MTLAAFDHVSRRYGDVTALEDVSVAFDAGQIVGLLGPNGAGKTTMLSLLTGLRPPTSGTVTLFGGSPREARNRVRLGTTPQETALPEALRVGEIIDFVGRHYPDRVPVDELAAMFGLGDLLRRQAGALSGGQKRRLSVALAFAGRPDLVLLDEPTTGLDVDARHTLWEALRARHRAGATIIVTSHYLEEIEALAERVVVVGSGRILADDTLTGALARVRQRQLRLRTDSPHRLASLAGVTAIAAEADDVTLVVSTDSDATVQALVRSDIPFRDLTVRGASLEEAFLTLTDTAARAAA